MVAKDELEQSSTLLHWDLRSYSQGHLLSHTSI